MLVAILAQFALFLLGMTVKQQGLHRRYQANSVKDKAVLSYQFIGLRAFKDQNLKLKRIQFDNGFNFIQQLIREQCNV